MIALTDRMEPWARRFQRAPRDAPAPEAAPARDTGTGDARDGAAGTDESDREVTTTARRSRRFARGVLQER
jgi:hypothetical protein